MLSRSVPSASNKTFLFMALEAYIPSASKANCVISSGLFFPHREDNLHFHRSISTIPIRCNRHNSGCHIITICSM